MKRILIFTNLLVLAVSSQAQQPALGSLPPMHWFDASHGSIRSIVGWSGAARVGDAAIEGASAGSVAPGGKSALVRLDGHWNWVSGLDGEPSLEVLDELPADLASIAWSADGRCAAIVIERAAVRRLCRDGAGVTASAPTPIANAARTAISASRRWLAVTTQGGDGAELWIADSDGNAARMIFGICPAAITFAAKKDLLYVADCRSGEVFEISPLAAGSAPVSLGEADPEGPAAAILETIHADLLALVRPDGRTAALFSRQARAVVADFWFHEPVDRLQRLFDGVYLALPKESKGLVQMIDFRREEIVFFVPAAD